MNFSRTLRLLFDIRIEETTLVGLLLVHSFLSGIPRNFSMVASKSLFLEVYGAENLPYVYLGGALSVALLGVGYVRIQRQLGTYNTLRLNLLFSLITLLMIYAAIQTFDADWPVLLFAIWSEVEFVLIGMQFWGLANRLMNVQQGKRLLALVGTGEVVAIIIGGLLIKLLTLYIDTVNLIWFSAFGVAGCLLMVKVIFNKFEFKLKSEFKELPAIDSNTHEKIPFRSRYVIMLFTLGFLINSSFYFVDNAFLESAKGNYPDAEALAGFLGTFAALVAFISFINRTFIVGRYLTSFGLIGGLLILPVNLFIGSLSITVSDYFVPSVSLIFWLTALTKLADRSLRFTVNNTAQMILYQPFEESIRTRVQAIVSGIVEPLGAASAALVLLLCQNWFTFQEPEMALILMGITLCWLVLCFLTRDEYAVMISRNLGRRKIRLHEEDQLHHLNGSLHRPNADTLALIQQELTSPYAENVIYAMDLLEQAAPQDLENHLQPLLHHTQKEVRLNALNRVERLGLKRFVSELHAMLETETDIEIKGAVVRAICALSEVGVQLAITYLEHSSETFKREILVGLMRSGSIEGVVRAGSELMPLINSRDKQHRLFAVRVLGQAGLSEFYRPLMFFLVDPERKVRAEALRAAGQVKSHHLWPLVIRSLSDPELSSKATTALISGGGAVIAPLAAEFSRNQHNQQIQIRILRICGLIHTPETTQFLWSQIDYHDEDVKHAVLVALKNCGYQATETQAMVIKKKIHEELEDAAWTCATLEDLSTEPASVNLSRSFDYEILLNIERIFMLMSLVYPRQAVLQAWENFQHGNADKKAFAMELLENVIPFEMRFLVFPMLQDMPNKDRLKKFRNRYPQKLLGFERRLSDLLAWEEKWITHWSKCCILKMVVDLQRCDLYPQIKAKLHEPDPLVQEAVLWALKQLNQMQFVKDWPDIKPDLHPDGLQAGEALVRGWRFEPVMNKVLRLKQVELFVDIREGVLVDLLPRLEYLEFPAQFTLFEYGELGDCMYIILEGAVQVHLAGKVLVEMGENSIFGEFTVLTSAPRTASVTTLSHCKVYRITQSVLYELISANVEVARSLIHCILKKLKPESHER